MPIVPDIHGVVFFFDVIWPDRGFDEGSSSIVTETINCQCEFPEVCGCVYIEFIQPDFSDGSNEHVPNIPPARYKQRKCNY